MASGDRHHWGQGMQWCTGVEVSWSCHSAKWTLHSVKAANISIWTIIWDWKYLPMEPTLSQNILWDSRLAFYIVIFSWDSETMGPATSPRAARPRGESGGALQEKLRHVSFRPILLPNELPSGCNHNDIVYTPPITHIVTFQGIYRPVMSWGASVMGTRGPVMSPKSTTLLHLKFNT